MIGIDDVILRGNFDSCDLLTVHNQLIIHVIWYYIDQ